MTTGTLCRPPVSFIESKDGLDTDLTYLFDQEGTWSDDDKTVSLDVSGYLFNLSTFGWPLVIAGSLKVVYDLTLLKMFQHVKPPEEQERERANPDRS